MAENVPTPLELLQITARHTSAALLAIEATTLRLEALRLRQRADFGRAIEAGGQRAEEMDLIYGSYESTADSLDSQAAAIESALGLEDPLAVLRERLASLRRRDIGVVKD